MTIPLPRTTPEALTDLRLRLQRRRPVPRVSPTDRFGVDPASLDAVLDYWADSFDWEAQEERIHAYPWRRSATPTPVNAIVQAADADSPVVLFLHGWPDSVLRFERILPELSGITAVVPALPGFPFAATQDGLSAVDIAEAVHAAMIDFGFHRFVVSAGDVGCDVAEALAAAHPDAVSSLHLTDVSQYHFLVDLPDDLDAEERAYVERGRLWQAAEGGYMHEQSTRPDTASVGLGDSPAGLAAWIGEKLDRWTDQSSGPAFSMDERLTWLSAYWFSGTIGTSFAPYALSSPKDWPRITAPTVFTVFPGDLVNAPRRFAERFFSVVSWREFSHGGHFAAWEQPDDYLWGVREAVRICD
ncbi:alpha/beta fold hydrolase [Curtobacterium pusillum]|uniref:alpha/beta fold hydrolase n=1 Tax=Curtobacterium pusillum TaxID=69373 RepID=UPI0011A8FE1C|nr:alpha/beta fold hydrolase [Curtobacterium pusillum]